MRSLQKIISGGQAGADRAALDVAIRHGFPHGGWCPRGRIAEDGPLDAKYLLQETESDGYVERTERKIRDSEGTFLFSFSTELTGGSLRTYELCLKHGKPFMHLAKNGRYREWDLNMIILNFIRRNDITVLNIAGSRESKEPGIYEWTREYLENSVFWSHNNPGVLGGPGEG